MTDQQPHALMSYTRDDDQRSGAYLTTFRKKLSDEVSGYIGQPFHIFQDIEDIKWGQQFEQRIEDALATITFFLPILTPSFFRSEFCRYELERFLQREAALGRNDLVLPVYYIRVPALQDPARRGHDSLAQTIAARQYRDWRELRFEPFTSPQVRRMLAAMAEQIADALEQHGTVLPTPPVSQPASVPPLPPQARRPTQPPPREQPVMQRAPEADDHAAQRVRLRDILVNHFDTEELRTLCFDLGTDYDNLGGEGKAGKVRELVAFLERHGGIADLIALGQRLRPDADWGVPPEAPSTLADPMAFAEPAPIPSTPAPAPQPAPPPSSAASIPDGREPDGADGVHQDERDPTPARTHDPSESLPESRVPTIPAGLHKTEREAAPLAAPVAQPTPPNPARDRQQSTDPATSTPPKSRSSGRTPTDKKTARPRRTRTMLLALVVLLLVAGVLLTVREWPPSFGSVAVVPTTPTTTMTTTSTPSATDAPASEPGIVAVPIGTTDQVLEFVEIPAGSFLMGSRDDDPLAADDEQPQHELTLDTYWIGQTEVTNAQFRPFVAGDGYDNRDYWTEAGWQWKEEEGIVQPRFWDDTEWNGADQPVVGVSWFEAVAYARWVSAQTGQELRLPTEAEWEKAARGPERLIYPWGDGWREGYANTKEAGIGTTTPVGSYPDGASPYGVLDMAGNVWEWTATKWLKDYPYSLEDEWNDAYLADYSARALRGCSYACSQQFVRGADRSYNDDPRDRDINNGLRLASHSIPQRSDE
jgi:formylglycine-generating enzyme required for sulfatase activity